MHTPQDPFLSGQQPPESPETDRKRPSGPDISPTEMTDGQAAAPSDPEDKTASDILSRLYWRLRLRMQRDTKKNSASAREPEQAPDPGNKRKAQATGNTPAEGSEERQKETAFHNAGEPATPQERDREYLRLLLEELRYPRIPNPQTHFDEIREVFLDALNHRYGEICFYRDTVQSLSDANSQLEQENERLIRLLAEQAELVRDSLDHGKENRTTPR